ncbi:MAG: helix-turn-helix transcriptional regulator [Gemmatimonadota bacterium]
MDVLALLLPLDRSLLQRALTPRYTVRFVDTWVGVETAIREHPVGVLVADFCIEQRPDVGKLRQLRLMFPSVSVLVWVSLSHDVAPALVECGKIGVAKPLLRGYTTEKVIVHEVAQQMSEGIHTWTLDLILRHLGNETPARLRWVMKEILEAPAEIRTAEELARRARVDTRTVFRWFRRARLATPHTVITAARVLLAGRMLQDPGLTVEDVARRLGYSDPRYLAEHARKLVGMTPGELRLSFDDAVPQLAAAMLDDADSVGGRVRSLPS